MIENGMYGGIFKMMLRLICSIGLVAIANASNDSTTAIPANESSLINTTASPKPPNTGLPAVNRDLDCARRSLVGPEYNRVFQPLPNEDTDKPLGLIHSSTKAKGSPKSNAIIVRIMADLLRIMEINEHEEIIVLLMKLKQFWTDSRIKPPPEYLKECQKIKRLSNESVRYLPEVASKTIWFPDVYLNRVEELHISKVLVNTEEVRVDNHGNVEYTLFGRFKLSCEMNFRHFPLDVQYCPMYVESWRIRITEQDLIWDQEHPIGLLHDYNIDQFSLSVVVLRIKNVEYDSGQFARIGFVMILSRKLPFYLLQIYLPTVLFVIISWLTFFIPAPYAQGRIILTITTLLALTALNSIISKHSPSASYLRGIDVWMQGCFLFVFVAIVDCLIDIRLLYVVSQSYKQEKPSFFLPVSVALVENREVFDDLFGGERLDDEDGDWDNDANATPSIYADAPEPESEPTSGLGPSFLRVPPQGDTGRRVSFADDTPMRATSLVSARPRHAESELCQMAETPPDPSDPLERRALMFEKLSIITYPVLFLLFNVCYWSYYLNAAQIPDALKEEIAGGFIPSPRQPQH